MLVNWTTLESFAENNGINQLSYIALNGRYQVLLMYGAFKLECTIPIVDPPSIDQADFEANWKSSANQSPQKQNVVTQFELTNFLLQCASDDQPADPTSGIATVNFLVPGTFNGVAPGSSGRYVDWGQGWFNPADPMDMISGINVIDTNGRLGVPPGTTVFTYLDAQMPPNQQGVRIPYKFGHSEVEPLGYYGFLPSEMTLQIVGTKRTPVTGARLFVNLFWGIQNG